MVLDTTSTCLANVAYLFYDREKYKSHRGSLHAPFAARRASSFCRSIFPREAIILVLCLVKRQIREQTERESESDGEWAMPMSVIYVPVSLYLFLRYSPSN